ncbi:hypothetical protein [Endozoicomonas elysicola]|uniref:Uncharacterized protein n=1 Tax=Endozoicomonas elysicola TaxID=305900 RepID=A0A081K723_9GAMM|nr:hypothetical protein [Endozoicomonas elysicola]KEI69949.1 hypothetical protein GV64_03595 [Endozoicomonas elysicola]
MNIDEMVDGWLMVPRVNGKEPTTRQEGDRASDNQGTTGLSGQAPRLGAHTCSTNRPEKSRILHQENTARTSDNSRQHLPRSSVQQLPPRIQMRQGSETPQLTSSPDNQLTAKSHFPVLDEASWQRFYDIFQKNSPGFANRFSADHVKNALMKALKEERVSLETVKGMGDIATLTQIQKKAIGETITQCYLWKPDNSSSKVLEPLVTKHEQTKAATGVARRESALVSPSDSSKPDDALLDLKGDDLATPMRRDIFLGRAGGSSNDWKPVDSSQSARPRQALNSAAKNNATPVLQGNFPKTPAFTDTFALTPDTNKTKSTGSSLVSGAAGSSAQLRPLLPETHGSRQVMAAVIPSNRKSSTTREQSHQAAAVGSSTSRLSPPAERKQGMPLSPQDSFFRPISTQTKAPEYSGARPKYPQPVLGSGLVCPKPVSPARKEAVPARSTGTLSQPVTQTILEPGSVHLENATEQQISKIVRNLKLLDSTMDEATCSGIEESINSMGLDKTTIEQAAGGIWIEETRDALDRVRMEYALQKLSPPSTPSVGAGLASGSDRSAGFAKPIASAPVVVQKKRMGLPPAHNTAEANIPASRQAPSPSGKGIIVGTPLASQPVKSVKQREKTDRALSDDAQQLRGLLWGLGIDPAKHDQIIALKPHSMEAVELQRKLKDEARLSDSDVRFILNCLKPSSIPFGASGNLPRAQADRAVPSASNPMASEFGSRRGGAAGGNKTPSYHHRPVIQSPLVETKQSPACGFSGSADAIDGAATRPGLYDEIMSNPFDDVEAENTNDFGAVLNSGNLRAPVLNTGNKPSEQKEKIELPIPATPVPQHSAPMKINSVTEYQVTKILAAYESEFSDLPVSEIEIIKKNIRLIELDHKQIDKAIQRSWDTLEAIRACCLTLESDTNSNGDVEADGAGNYEPVFVPAQFRPQALYTGSQQLQQREQTVDAAGQWLGMGAVSDSLRLDLERASEQGQIKLSELVSPNNQNSALFGSNGVTPAQANLILAGLKKEDPNLSDTNIEMIRRHIGFIQLNQEQIDNAIHGGRDSLGDILFKCKMRETEVVAVEPDFSLLASGKTQASVLVDIRDAGKYPTQGITHSHGNVALRVRAGIQARNNNCGLASFFISLSHNGLLDKLIEDGENKVERLRASRDLDRARSLTELVNTLKKFNVGGDLGKYIPNDELDNIRLRYGLRAAKLNRNAVVDALTKKGQVVNFEVESVFDRGADLNAVTRKAAISLRMSAAPVQGSSYAMVVSLPDPSLGYMRLRGIDLAIGQKLTQTDLLGLEFVPLGEILEPIEFIPPILDEIYGYVNTESGPLQSLSQLQSSTMSLKQKVSMVEVQNDRKTLDSNSKASVNFDHTINDEIIPGDWILKESETVKQPHAYLRHLTGKVTEHYYKDGILRLKLTKDLHHRDQSETRKVFDFFDQHGNIFRKTVVEMETHFQNGTPFIRARESEFVSPQSGKTMRVEQRMFGYGEDYPMSGEIKVNIMQRAGDFEELIDIFINSWEARFQGNVERARRALLPDEDNSPEIIFMTIPNEGKDNRCKFDWQKDVTVPMYGSDQRVPYEVSAVMAIEGSHYLSWRRDPQNGLIHFADSMGDIDDNRVTIPVVVTMPDQGTDAALQAANQNINGASNYYKEAKDRLKALGSQVALVMLKRKQ